IYSATYSLVVTSPHGTVAGSGWYPEGSVANATVSPTSTQGILADSSFSGWTGDVSASTIVAGVQMDGPKTVTASWHDNYLKMVVYVAVAGAAIGVFVYLKKVLPARKAKAAADAESPPDLDWFKP